MKKFKYYFKKDIMFFVYIPIVVIMISINAVISVFASIPNVMHEETLFISEDEQIALETTIPTANYYSTAYVKVAIKPVSRIIMEDIESMSIATEEIDLIETLIYENHTEIPITNEEIELLEKLVEAEAGGEPYNGKVAVVNVVFNRVRSEFHPDTVMDVILQPIQFSCVKNGEINITPLQESKDAVKEAMTGYKIIGSDINYYLNRNTATNKWIVNNKEFAIKIGKHSFYYE